MESKRFYQTGAQGLVYPFTLEVRERDGVFEVWDITGWNGYEECGDEWVASFGSELAAESYAVQMCYQSNFEAVFNAALALLDKEPGAWKQLKESVAWQDRR